LDLAAEDMRREGEALIVSVGDLVRVGDDFWEVAGVHLGAVNQEDLYRLEPVTLRRQEYAAMVPRKLFEAACRSGSVIGYSAMKEEEDVGELREVRTPLR
jgi:hypothetical protein